MLFNCLLKTKNQLFSYLQLPAKCVIIHCDKVQRMSRKYFSSNFLHYRNKLELLSDYITLVHITGIVSYFTIVLCKLNWLHVA